nr:glycosyltransferase family A protein [uncultured Actinoplanes sp.]
MTLVEQTTTQPPRTADPGGYQPAAVLDVEVSEPITAIPAIGPDGRRRDRAWLLVRLFGEPIGTVTVPLTADGGDAPTVAATIDAELHDVIRDRAAAAGVPAFAALPVGGFRAPRTPPYLAGREAALRAAPTVSVVISTRDRTEALSRCVPALLAQQYPHLQVVIVDNAPSTDDTRRWVLTQADDRVKYVIEPRPGLSWARNLGIACATGDIVAFIDDDEVPDPHWLAELARAFHDHPDADAVSGVIIPAELETYPQELFERYGGHSKGRGFTPAVFSPLTAHEQSPMYPLPPFGTGGNMAFRREFFAAAGTFDVALGAGTATQGAEDTEMMSRVLLRGGTVVYQPSVLVRHYHRRTWEGLHAVMHGYGVGLTAYYASLLLADPRRLLPLARLLPTAVRDMFTARGRSSDGVADDFPRPLLAAKRRALITGPYQYLIARVRARRLARLT